MTELEEFMQDTILPMNFNGNAELDRLFGLDIPKTTDMDDVRIDSKKYTDDNELVTFLLTGKIPVKLKPDPS